MYKFLLVLALIGFICSTSHAQEASKVDIFGGYSYANIDTSSNGLVPRQSANGWEASVSANLVHWLAAEGDLAGYYKNYPFNVDASAFGAGFLTGQINASDFSFAAGPRVNFPPLFAHALIGFDHLGARATGNSTAIGPFDLSASQNSFAAVFGGGLQQRVSSHWAIRASADYALTRHNIFKVVDPSLSAYTQNNFRVSAGIVFTFGGGTEVSRTQSRRSAPSRHVPMRHMPIRSSASGASEASLLGVSGYATDSGFTVTSVRDGSPAAQAGIATDDVITMIDGRPVRSSIDIEQAIAASQTGIVKVSYLIRGAWLTEKDVQISTK